MSGTLSKVQQNVTALLHAVRMYYRIAINHKFPVENINIITAYEIFEHDYFMKVGFK